MDAYTTSPIEGVQVHCASGSNADEGCEKLTECAGLTYIGQHMLPLRPKCSKTHRYALIAAFVTDADAL